MEPTTKLDITKGEFVMGLQSTMLELLAESGSAEALYNIQPVIRWIGERILAAHESGQ